MRSTADGRRRHIRSGSRIGVGIRVFPETFAVYSLNACINVSMTTDTLRTFQLFGDFAAINHKDCFEVKWSKDMTTLPTVSETRLLTFWRVPPTRQSREERLPTRFICVPCRTWLTSCTPSVVTGLPTDCYVDKIRLEPLSSEGLCSNIKDLNLDVLSAKTGGAESFSHTLTQSSLRQLSRSVLSLKGGGLVQIRSWTACVPQSSSGMTRARTVSMHV